MDPVLGPLQRLYEEVINAGRLEVLDELYGPGYVNHIAPFGLSQGIDGLRVLFGEFASAFPDQHIVADAMYRVDNLAIARWTISGTHKNSFFGVAPTNRRFTMTGVDIERVEDGRIVEHWGAEDMLALLAQIRAIEMPEMRWPEHTR